MKITVVMADPAGNRTAIVRDPVPAGERGVVAARIMELPELRAEQVGFEVPPRLGGAGRLEMMGGEFCGNAARSFGFLLWKESAAPVTAGQGSSVGAPCGEGAGGSMDRLHKAGKWHPADVYEAEGAGGSMKRMQEEGAPFGRGRKAGTVRIEISGAEGLLEVYCEAARPSAGADVPGRPVGGGSRYCEAAQPSAGADCIPGTHVGCAGRSFAQMPMPSALEYTEEGWPLVAAGGIAHLILEDMEPDEGFVRQMADRYAARFPAFGMQFLSGGRLIPVVSVPAVGSLVYESSCGSGSLAAAWYLARREGRHSFSCSFREPGGIIEVRIRGDGDGIMGGGISLEAERTVRIG